MSDSMPEASAGKLIIVSMPSKTAYAPGDVISYAGLRVELDGVDVTKDCMMSVVEGNAWKSSDDKLVVVVSHPEGGETSFTLKKKRRLGFLLWILLGVLVAVAAVVVWQVTNKPFEGDTGTYIIPKGNMTNEEAQKLVDEMAEKSRITVSVSPQMILTDDGQLRVNFIVVKPNNGLGERLEVIQDGKVVYRSGIVEPGYKVEYGQSEGAHEGPATATVYAIKDGADSGNPIAVDVEIVKSEK